MDVPFSATQFVRFKVALAATMVAALLDTRVNEFYPNADVIIRIRRRQILPNIEIQDRVEKEKGMQ